MITSSQILAIIVNGLSTREKEVLAGRFGLDKNGRPQTLAALGEKYGVTRERVRQIESGALKSAKKNISDSSELSVFLEKAKEILRNSGGAIKSEPFIEALREHAAGITDKHAALLAEASKTFFLYQEDFNYHEFFYLDKNQLKKALLFIKQWSESLDDKKQSVLAGSYSALFSDFIKRKGIQESHAAKYLEISKSIDINPYGDKGLARWPEIRPKTIRDRVYLVLKKRGEPLHFRAISKSINDMRFDAKKASAPTVHNELIKDKRFVLVGRGMYALAEHGYVSGTAKEVIQRILSKQGPLTARQVILAVQKERFFKPNTVLVNLQNKVHFVRLEDGSYHIKQS